MSSRDNAQSKVAAHLSWVHVGLLVGLTAAIYHGAFDFGFFPNWDDSRYLVDRLEVRDWFAASWTERLLTPAVGYPIPLPTLLYFWLSHLPGELVVPATHLLSLAFHFVNVVLVYALGARWLGRARLALAAAALWAAHPLLVESIAWATNLKTVTWASFLLGSLWVWDSHLRWPSWRRAAGAVALFLLALACRPEGVIAAPLWIGIALWRDPGALRERRHWAPAALAAVMAAVYVPVAIAGHDALVLDEPVQRQMELTLIERLWEVGVAFGMQLRHVVWPIDLHPSYTPRYPGAEGDFVVGVTCAVALLAVTVWAVRRRSRLMCGLSLFWLAYLPASGITYLPRFTADTYMYLPLAGLILALVAATAKLGQYVGPRLARYGWLVAALAVFFFAALAYAQTLRWSNELTLWEPVMEANPNNPQAYWMVGEAYASVEHWDEAARVYREGFPHLYQRQRIPVTMVEALRKTGDEQQAARVAATIATYEGLGRPQGAVKLLELLAADSVQLAVDEHLQAALDEVTARGLDTLDLDSSQFGVDEATEVADEALQAGVERAAAELLSYALERNREHCEAWRLAELLDGELRRVATGGEAPAGPCR